MQVIRQRNPIIKKENCIMEKYEELEMETIVFDSEDVIVTSGGNDNTEWT